VYRLVAHRRATPLLCRLYLVSIKKMPGEGKEGEEEVD
jgi:hypothetical protein